MNIYLNKITPPIQGGVTEIKPYVYKSLKPTSKVGAWYFSNELNIACISPEGKLIYLPLRKYSDIERAGFIYITDEWHDICKSVVEEFKIERRLSEETEESLKEYIKNNYKRFQGTFITQSANYIIKDCKIECIKSFTLDDLITLKYEHNSHIGELNLRRDYKMLQYRRRGSSDSLYRIYRAIKLYRRSKGLCSIKDNVATIFPRTRHNKLGKPIKVFCRKIADKRFYFNYAK